MLGLVADKDELKDVKNVFYTLDENMDGNLCSHDIKEANLKLERRGSSKKWGKVLEECDLDGDGQVDFHEFHIAAVNHQKVMTRENLRIAFDVLDKDHSGAIDINELKMALPSKKFGEVHCEDDNCFDEEHMKDN